MAGWNQIHANLVEFPLPLLLLPFFTVVITKFVCSAVAVVVIVVLEGRKGQVVRNPKKTSK